MSGDESFYETDPNDTLEMLMNKIEETKYCLLEGAGGKNIESQLQMANLIEKLASAAAAVRKLEEMH
jgi:hypothetical protein